MCTFPVNKNAGDNESIKKLKYTKIGGALKNIVLKFTVVAVSLHIRNKNKRVFKDIAIKLYHKSLCSFKDLNTAGKGFLFFDVVVSHVEVLIGSILHIIKYI